MNETYPQRVPRDAPRLPWLWPAAILVSAGVLLALLAGVWQFLAPLAATWSALLGTWPALGGLFVLLIASLVAGVIIWWLIGLASRARLVRVGDAVVDLRAVRQVNAQRVMDRHFDHLQAQAENPPLPQGYHYAPRLDLAPPATPPAVLQDAPSAAAPTFATDRTVVEQLHQRGHICRSGHSLLVGYDTEGQPQYIEMAECGFLAVAGMPRYGKSTTVKLLLSQAAMMGWHIVVADPHAQKPTGLINVCRPLSGAFLRQAVTPEEINDLVRWVDKIGQRRLQGDPIDKPVLLVIDEFSNLVLRGQLDDDVLALLPAMAMAYAGVGVHGVLVGHDWNAKLLGGSLGATMRRCVTHRMVHRLQPDAAGLLLPSGGLARQAAEMERGQALYWGSDVPTVVRVPWVDEADLGYAAQGRPEKPYTPRPVAQLAAPAPRQLPPTQPLPARTVETAILELLSFKPGLLSPEILATLAAEFDEGTIKNAITTMSPPKGTALRREGPKGKFRHFVAES